MCIPSTCVPTYKMLGARPGPALKFGKQKVRRWGKVHVAGDARTQRGDAQELLTGEKHLTSCAFSKCCLRLSVGVLLTSRSVVFLAVGIHCLCCFVAVLVCVRVCARVCLFVCSPPGRKGLLDFMLESAFAMLLHHPVSRQSSSPVHPAEYPARAARQWIPPSIPPRQSGSPVDPAEYPARAARRCIPPSIPPELLASGSRPVSRQSCLPVDPADRPARVARLWIPPSNPPQIPSIPLSIPE